MKICQGYSSRVRKRHTFPAVDIMVLVLIGMRVVEYSVRRGEWRQDLKKQRSIGGNRQPFILLN